MVSHSYAEGDENINDSNDKNGHFYIPSLKDSSYRRRPKRHCIWYRRSSRGRGEGGWGLLPAPTSNDYASCLSML